MTPTRIPHDDKPDYDVPAETAYRVQLDDGSTVTITTTEIAEKLTNAGYRVTATTGYLG